LHPEARDTGLRRFLDDLLGDLRRRDIDAPCTGSGSEARSGTAAIPSTVVAFGFTGIALRPFCT
jgi:hypothetical protein